MEKDLYIKTAINLPNEPARLFWGKKRKKKEENLLQVLTICSIESEKSCWTLAILGMECVVPLGYLRGLARWLRCDMLLQLYTFLYNNYISFFTTATLS
jgi:hypothetical protein